MDTVIDPKDFAYGQLATGKLTGKLRRSHQRFISFDAGMRTRRASQPPENYWDRKIRGLNIFQLRNLARRIPKRSRKVSRLLSKLHKASRFAAPLRHEAWANNLKMSIVTDEAIRRNAFVA